MRPNILAEHVRVALSAGRHIGRVALVTGPACAPTYHLLAPCAGGPVEEVARSVEGRVLLLHGTRLVWPPAAFASARHLDIGHLLPAVG